MAYYAAMAGVTEKWLSGVRDMGGARRELAIALAGLLLGALVMPLLVWAAGMLALGPYGNGGLGALFADFFRGLATGSSACWIVLAGPYLVISLVRLLRRTLAGIDARTS
jgi:hypothetical protein